MLAKLFGLRPEDYRDTVVAFCTLVGVLAGHAMLETARDALFLASLPASQLAWAYLAIAGFALVATKFNQRAMARFSRRRALSVTLLAGAAVTVGLWAVLESNAAWALFAFYVWTGVLTTVVVVQFWLHLGDVLNVSQAKRAFALIGSGGLIGAAVGSAAAGGLLVVFPPRVLLVVAAAIFVATSFAPMCFSAGVPAPQRRRHAVPPSPGLRLLKGDAYLKRLFALVLISTLMVTGVDFLFKTVVAAKVDAAQLGEFFARYYAGVNVVALVVQLVLAPRLLRSFGVSGTLLVLPVLLLSGAVGFVLLAGMLPVLILKGADSTLRHSVNKTASEILYLPLSTEVRSRFKGIAESIAQRGGQALASVILLGAVALDATPRHIGLAIAALGVLWLATVGGLKPLYLELFRKQLREGRLETEVGIPDLDLSSMEALVAALSSEDDSEVTAALDLFEQHGKTNLIPALILYHPSRDVVLRAFELFANSDRTDVARLTERLLKHDDSEIRAAALRLHASIRPNEEMLRSFLENDCPSLRATALLGLLSAGIAEEDEIENELREMIESNDHETHLALARTLRYLPGDEYAWLGVELAEMASMPVRVELARSIAGAPHPGYLPTLVNMLQFRETRNQARAALVAIGDPALNYVDQQMADRSLSKRVRRHLPRTVSRFTGDLPVKILQERLLTENDEVVTLKILRGLGRMRANDPTISVDQNQLLEVTRRTLERAVTALNWRLALDATIRAVPQAKTEVSGLLRSLLIEKEQAALERVFRLLHILEPREEFRMIYDGLRGSDTKARAGSLELLEYVVPDAIRRGILAMVDDVADHQRLNNAAPFFDPAGRSRRVSLVARLDDPSDEVRATALYNLGIEYRDRMREMLKDSSGVLRSMAGYHIAELGLDELKTDVEEAAATREGDPISAITDRAMGLFNLGNRPELTGAS